MVPAVRFERVVEPKVVDPVAYKLVLKSDVNAPILDVMLRSVVDASVLDPDTARFVRLRVFALRVPNAAV